jgi:putative ABC transport system substrate-binding protein
MRRREFIAGIGAGALLPLAARAQQKPGSMPLVVYLGPQSSASVDPRNIEQFRVGLAESGLIDGQNVKVEYLWGEGSTEILRKYATDLAARDVDVIVTAGPQPVRALLDAKVRSPIVFAILNDPVGDGFIKSLARPGGNLTGLSMAGTDLETKRLEILNDALHGMRKVMVLHDPTMGLTGVEQTVLGGRSMGIEVVVADTNDPDKIKELFAGAAAQGISGVATMASPFFNFNRKRLIEASMASRLPSIWEATTYVRDGGLLAYGPSFSDMYRRSAGYVARILKGAKPEDLPVEQPTRFELAVNLRTARSLGIEIPPALISRADEVIE